MTRTLMHPLPFTFHRSRAVAYFAQVAEAVDARVVAVAPAEGEGVATDQRDVLDLQLLGDRLGLEHALAGELVDALRARAQAAQPRRLVDARPPVAPRDAQTRVRLLHDLARLDGRAAPQRFAHNDKEFSVSSFQFPVKA